MTCTAPYTPPQQPHPQEPEYRIKESELREISNPYLLDVTHKKNTRERAAFVDEVRSRGPIQQVDPVKMGEISKICKLCNYEGDCKEHDATIAAAAREKAEALTSEYMRELVATGV
jgi:hypothetical protein